jgi:hypothetical protein
MNFSEEFALLSKAEQDEFRQVVNVLLLKSFVIRENYDARTQSLKTNPDFRYLERHFDLVEEYLNFANWHIEKDLLLGVIILSNHSQDNVIRLDRETSLLVFVLRYIYENSRSTGANNTGEMAYLTTPELLKTMEEYNITIPNKKLTCRSLSRSLKMLNAHNIIAKIHGSYDDGDATFHILPSIVYAIDNQKITTLSEYLAKVASVDDSTGGPHFEDLE